MDMTETAMSTSVIKIPKDLEWMSFLHHLSEVQLFPEDLHPSVDVSRDKRSLNIRIVVEKENGNGNGQEGEGGTLKKLKKLDFLIFQGNDKETLVIQLLSSNTTKKYKVLQDHLEFKILEFTRGYNDKDIFLL